MRIILNLFTVFIIPIFTICVEKCLEEASLAAHIPLE